MFTRQRHWSTLCKFGELLSGQSYRVGDPNVHMGVLTHRSELRFGGRGRLKR